jgi:hypothetical protein
MFLFLGDAGGKSYREEPGFVQALYWIPAPDQVDIANRILSTFLLLI